MKFRSHFAIDKEMVRRSESPPIRTMISQQKRISRISPKHHPFRFEFLWNSLRKFHRMLFFPLKLKTRQILLGLPPLHRLASSIIFESVMNWGEYKNLVHVNVRSAAEKNGDGGRSNDFAMEIKEKSSCCSSEGEAAELRRNIFECCCCCRQRKYLERHNFKAVDKELSLQFSSS